MTPAWRRDPENSARNSPVLRTRGLPPWLVALVVDWHGCNCWSFIDLETVVMTLAWVWPGDPMADLVFNMLMWRLLCDIEDALKNERLLSALPELPTEGLLQPAR